MNLKFSQDIESLLKRLADEPLTLKDILAQTSERGFSLIITLFAIPFLFPMPPGLSSPLGAGCFLLGMQMALGMRSPWLPRKVAEWKFPKKFIGVLLTNVKKIIRILEKITRPRWSKIAANPWIWKINGLCIAWLAFLLILPIPATNPFPAGSILLLAVSTLEADGLLMFISYICTGLTTSLFAGIGYLLWQAPEILQKFLPMFFEQ